MRSEIVVVVLGLIVGYCLVNYLLSRGKVSNASTREPPADPWQDSARSDTGQHAREAGTPTWFEVLGVAETASGEQIDRAYRVAIGQYHPDKVARLGEDIQRLAETRSKEINAAYDEGTRRAMR